MKIPMMIAGGREVDLLDLKPHVFEIGTIAASLSLQNRFNGHTTLRGQPVPYSVAAHSVLVCMLVDHETRDPGLALTALLHDAHKVIVGDISRPVIEVLGRQGIKKFSMEVQAQIATKYKLGVVIFPTEGNLFPGCVAEWDKWAARWEMSQFFPGCPEPEGTEDLVAVEEFRSGMITDAVWARETFLALFHRLTSQIKMTRSLGSSVELAPVGEEEA